MNRCRSCGRETQTNLCPRCEREFDRGDPKGPMAEMDEESYQARQFFAATGGEVDDWRRDG